MDDTGREGEANGSTGDRSGRRIPGFENLRRIGSGGSSTVYRATDVHHQRAVAIKVLDLETSSGPRRTAFQREIEAIGRVGGHPYVVTVLGSGFTTDDHPYLVLPLFERGTYGRLIDEHGPLTWADAVDVGIKLCSAVETVHRAGVVHRDIKPGNVFIGVTPEHPLLGDFGISSTIDGERTQTRTMAVTFGYTAPEVLDDERPTPASDIYSLAMTIYRLIQGLHAYHAETPAAIMRKILAQPDRPRLSAGVPPAVAEAVAEGLAKEPAGRPASALALARRLQQVQADQGLAPTPVVVADEPAVVLDSPAAGDEPTSSVAPTIEDSMVGAIRRRQQTDTGSVAAARYGQAIDAEEDDADDRVDAGARPADVGRILAAALAPHGDRPGPATPANRQQPPVRPAARSAVEDAGPNDEQHPSLDLPTVVTPRKPRREHAPTDGEPPSASDRSRRIGLVAVVLVAAVLVAAVLIAVLLGVVAYSHLAGLSSPIGS